MPPRINSDTISKDFFQVFKQLGIYILIFLTFSFLCQHAGIVLGMLFLFFAIMSIPAMIILLATTGRLFTAVNPSLFIRLAVRIGWGYLLMYLFLILLGSAPALLAKYIIQYMPPGLHGLLFSFAQSYYTIISYHLMGYVILQYHESVGYQVDYEDFRDPSANTGKNESEDTNAQILTRAGLLVKEGKLDEAIRFIKKETEADGITDLNLSERYLKLLKMKDGTSEWLDHCTTHLHLLAKDNQKGKALEVYSECLGRDKQFAPTALTLFKLAGWMNESGRIKEAIGTYKRLIKAYPEDPAVPKAYFRAAQIYHDRLMEPSRAKNILNALVKKYPNHEIVPSATNYLQHISP